MISRGAIMVGGIWFKINTDVVDRKYVIIRYYCKYKLSMHKILAN